MISYQDKYLKYKNKYLLTKKQFGGITDKQQVIINNLINYFAENSKINETYNEEEIFNKVYDIINENENEKPIISNTMNEKINTIVSIYTRKSYKPDIFEAIKFQFQDNKKSKQVMYTMLLSTIFDDCTDLETSINTFRKSYLIVFPDVIKNLEEYKRNLNLLKPNKKAYVIDEYRRNKQQNKERIQREEERMTRQSILRSSLPSEDQQSLSRQSILRSSLPSEDQQSIPIQSTDDDDL